MICPRCGTKHETPHEPCPHGHLTRRLADAPNPPVAPGAFRSGVRVRQGRYGLQERVAQRTWFVGVRETTWIGRDFQAQGARVLVYDIAFPAPRARALKATLRPATQALLGAVRHPMLPVLKEVFEEPDHLCFVFTSIEAESLQARLARRGGPLSEQEALEMCGEICAELDILAAQSPPLVHGWICPAHLFCAPGSSRFFLSPCSALLTHGDLRFLKGITAGGNASYYAPEMHRGVIDGRSDLYSLLATTYHAVTGVIPRPSRNDVPPARLFNAALSPMFSALLTQGLALEPQQRYQHPAELRQDVLAIASQVHQPLLERHMHAFPVAPPWWAETQPGGSAGGAALDVPHPFPIKPALAESATLLPSAEALPPMRSGHDLLEALILFFLVLLSSSIITALGSFHL